MLDIKINKKIIFFILITIISTLPIFFINDLPYGGDLNFHLKRIEAITINLKNGVIGNPIYSNYLNNYGYANGLFYPDLFLYIPATLNIIGFNLFTSYKIFLFLIKLSSLITMYISIKGITKNKYNQLVAVTLYAFSSYTFIDMFERGALAETITIVFIPLVIRGIYEIYYGNLQKYYFLPIGILGLLFSHVISLYITIIFLFIFMIINVKSTCKEKLKVIIKSVVIVLLIGSNFIFPLLEQIITNDFYFDKIIIHNPIKQNTVPIMLLFLEFPYYALMGNYLGRWIPCGIGIIYIYPIYYLLKNKFKVKKITTIFLYSGIATLLFAAKIPLWDIKLIRDIFSFIQFPYRIYILSTVLFIFAFITVLNNANLKTLKKIFLFSFIMFLLNIFYPFINIKTTNLTKDEIMYGEYLPIEYPNLNYHEERKNTIISDCDIQYDITSNIDTKINYKSNCENLEMELPIIYYKGYEIKINNQKVKINKSKNGLIVINTTEKSGIIEIKYKGTYVYNLTKYICIVTILIIVIKKIKDVYYEKKQI